MCPKPISACAEKGGSACSGPRTICKCKKGKVAGQPTPQFSAQGTYTILLFQASTFQAQVYSVCGADVASELIASDSLHRVRLRQSFATGRPSSYEWQSGCRVYQTTLLPLTSKEGQVDEVLSVTRDISAWGVSAQRDAHILHDGSRPRTFAQILLAARETEKREVAKALHDEIGTASVMLAALVSITKQSVQKGNQQQALKDLERLELQTQHSIERLRNIIVTLRPPSLDTDGALRGSLEELIQDVCALGRIEYRFVCTSRLPEKGISDRVKILLYRVVQEALSNVVKHARAHRVTVQLKRVEETMYLTVTDDGSGFKTTQRRSINHVGLRSMQDSVQLLGGQFEISSTPGKGTQIKVTCPCLVYEGNE